MIYLIIFFINPTYAARRESRRALTTKIKPTRGPLAGIYRIGEDIWLFSPLLRPCKTKGNPLKQHFDINENLLTFYIYLLKHF
jgi:hypothetical protein